MVAPVVYIGFTPLLDRDMKPIESVVCMCSAQGVGLLGCGLVGSSCVTVGVA